MRHLYIQFKLFIDSKILLKSYRPRGLVATAVVIAITEIVQVDKACVFSYFQIIKYSDKLWIILKLCSKFRAANIVNIKSTVMEYPSYIERLIRFG